MYRPAQSARTEEVRSLEEVAGDELEPCDEDDQDDRRGAPRFGDHDRGKDASEVVEREEQDRLVDHAGALKCAVQVTPFGEDREPENAGGEIGDRQRYRVDVQEEAMPAETRVDEQRHRQRKDDLQRHDENEEQKRVAPRVAEVHVGEHALEVLEAESTALRHHSEE